MYSQAQCSCLLLLPTVPAYCSCLLLLPTAPAYCSCSCLLAPFRRLLGRHPTRNVAIIVAFCRGVRNFGSAASQHRWQMRHRQTDRRDRVDASQDCSTATCYPDVCTTT